MISEITDNELYYCDWPTEKTPQASILLVHGLGEHCERYDTLADFLNEAGYSVYSMDLPGHGRSPGLRGHIESFDVFEKAVLTVYNRIKRVDKNTPVFILGHSMGGLIVTRLLQTQQDKFAGGLLSGPAIQSSQEPPIWQVMLIKMIAKLFPKLGAMELDASGISRDPAVVEEYLNDPLVSQSKLSAKFLVEMSKAMQLAIQNASEIRLPMLIMHGANDPMTAPSGSQALYDSISSTDKSIEIYDGLMHEIFNEPEAPDIFRQIVHWLDQRVN